MTDRLIRIKSVMNMTGKSRSAIYADIANGCFPSSISIGARSVAWAESTITAWIQAKIDKSKPQAISKKSKSFESDEMQRWDSLTKREQELEIKQARLNGTIHHSQI